MKNVFIDTNIWLDLYHFSSDDLDQFNKLKDLLDKNIKIFINKQVLDEVTRNRDGKVQDAYKQFESIKIQIPNLCKGYVEYATLNEIIKGFKSIHKTLIALVKRDITMGSLHADKVIKDIFDLLRIDEISQKQIDKAILRHNLGNPPGKNNSIGDAINWEYLLESIPDGENLFLVTDDRDYRSVINKNAIDNYLNKEWEEKKGSRIFFYESLTTFFNSHLKDIQLKTLEEKQELIKELEKSYNFSSTHRIINKLSEYSGYSDEETIDLLEIAITNDQVGPIIDDTDVFNYYRSILQGRVEKCKFKKYADILKKLKLIEEDTPEDDSSVYLD